ncbi:hypothetical protein VaNZ11_012192 [Volvox africanus]|uniref:EF-hand domain-containing protein n=1 Tax=Volvox africanus TaxID=51714 RepID=A0ABQ5SDI8_9CHLO|nr:hypothetical protein VaNZ11_012192 [Volvox africanus]
MTGDILFNASQLGAMLPSPSVLTGNFRPQTAAAFVEQTLAEARTRAACGSRLGTPALSQAHSQHSLHSKGRVEEVGALRSMASKHLGQLRQTPPAPYLPQHPPLPTRCLSTPPQRPHSSAIPPPLTPLLQPQPQPQPQPQSPRDLLLSRGGASGGGGAAAPALAARGHGRAAGGSDSPTVLAAGGGNGSPTGTGVVGGVVGGMHFVIETAPPQGAITACSSHPLFASHQVPTASTLPRLVLLPPDDASTIAVAGTPMGPSPPLTARSSDGANPNTGHSLPSTPPPPSPPPLAPAPAAADPQSSYQVHRGSRRFVQASPNASRPTTSLSVQDLSLPKPGSRLYSRSPTRGSGTQILDLSRTGDVSTGSFRALGGGSANGMGEGAAGSSSNNGSAAGTKTGGGNSAAPVATTALSPRSVGRFHHTATRWASEAAAEGALGSSEPTRPAGIKVTRGLLYSVFQELDEFDSGRLTYSAFEQAACKIGMRPAQAKRLYEHLDPLGRGYATMREWSSPQLQRQMEAFTRLYVQATRGADGRPKDITEVRSMHMAIQMAMVKLQLKRSGRAVSLDRLVQAFSYMDRDCNGALNAEEVEDALNSLGIFVSKDVVDTIMKTFDKDGNGCVDYYEFVKSLYPTLDSSVYHQ